LEKPVAKLAKEYLHPAGVSVETGCFATLDKHESLRKESQHQRVTEVDNKAEICSLHSSIEKFQALNVVLTRCRYYRQEFAALESVLFQSSKK